jgi:hypothetical protein
VSAAHRGDRAVDVDPAAGDRGLPLDRGQLAAEVRAPALALLHRRHEARDLAARGDRLGEARELGLVPGQLLTPRAGPIVPGRCACSVVIALESAVSTTGTVRTSRSTAARTASSVASMGTSRLFGQTARPRW